MRNPKKTLKKIRNSVEKYLLAYPNIDSLVIGVSGGIDSAMSCFILRPVCDKLDIKLIGRYIHIESNLAEELDRATQVGTNFCHNFKTVDLTDFYKESLKHYEEDIETEFNTKTKIRRGNIKARMRMIYLYNLAQSTRGIVVDNDNRTEHELGFWTLHGDVGDITPLSRLWKSDIYQLAKFVFSNNRFCEYFNSSNKLFTIKRCIDAIPTDGLGITSSDLEQLGSMSYEQVDEILKASKKPFFKLFGEYFFFKKYGVEVIEIMNRHLATKYKRNNPYKI